MDFKEVSWKRIFKSKIFIGIICFVLGALIFSKNSEVKTLSNKVNNKEIEVNKLTDENDRLKEKVNLSSEYLSLNDVEKENIDGRIKEVKQATEDELLKQKEQKEAEERAKAEEEAKKKAEAEQKEREAKQAAEKAKKEEEAHKYETGLTWEQIAREGHKGELCQFTGKVIQVMKGTGCIQYRVAINDNYDNIMLIEISNSKITKTILENDHIAFKGVSNGQITYTTVLGANMTIPSVIVDEYSIQ